MNAFNVNCMALQARCDLAMARVLEPIHSEAAAMHLQRALEGAYRTGQHAQLDYCSEQVAAEAELQDAFDQGRREMLDFWSTHGPLYVAYVEFRGVVWRDMYDEHPGLAYFDSPATWDLDELLGCWRWARSRKLRRSVHRMEQLLRNGCGLEQAMATAAVLLNRVASIDDDRRSVHAVCLRDQFGGLLQRLDSDGWIVPVPAEQWPAITEAANRLSSEAGIERGWDNFSTAEDLSERAGDLRDRVEVSQRVARVVERASACWMPLSLPATTAH